jgi:UDP-N-acetylglucosamine acyltransferase
MEKDIHPTAVVDPRAELGQGVRVAPYAVIGPRVEIGDGTEVGSGAQIVGPTKMGNANRVFAHACIGFDPQDLKFKGEETNLEIGDANTFREFCTVHRGTGLGGGRTTVGSNNLFMAYTHIAHDCHVGDHTIIANAGTLAGHVVVQDGATVGAFSSVHQFCRVGRHAYVGGYSIITKDALPFVRTVGAKPVCLGVNRIGMQRKGFDDGTIRWIEEAMRIVLRSNLNTSQAIERLRSELPGVPEVEQLIEFIVQSERGVIKTLPGRKGSRGGDG